MHRGTIFIITKDKNNQFKVEKSTEQNSCVVRKFKYTHKNTNTKLYNIFLNN